MSEPDLNAITALDPIADPTSTRTYGVGDDGQPLFALSAPPTVPGYEIEGELGRGGMGVVYKARDKKLDRPVALKIVLGGGHASPTTLTRFLAEAKAAAAVRHPGIAQVYELGEHDGLPFLAMEYCPGGTLANKLAGIPLPPRQAAELIEALAIAVNAAHRAGVVHRDLKPANILLQVASGQRTADTPPASPATSNWSLTTLTPMVSDFGLARQGDAGSGLTAPGAVLGSPSYMAPEQAEGKKEIGLGVDVYGLGAIFYECLTGRPPFRAVTPLETVMQVLKDDPVPPSRLVPKLPRDLETICLKCLQKDPRRRYASAAELADDLRRFLDGRTIAARPAGAIERSWKAAKRRPGAAAAIGAATLALAAVVGVVTWKNAELQRQRDAARVAETEADTQRLKAETLTKLVEGERDSARNARNRSEVRLLIALDAIERMMVHMAGEKWARNPALQAERRAVLEEAVAIYRSFQGDDGKEPIVRRRQAQAEFRVGTAYLSLADYARADEALATAEAIQKQLREEFPSEPEYANDLALTLVQAGQVRVLTARYEKGLEFYTGATEQARRATALAPARDEFKLTLAETLTALGNAKSSRGVDEAQKSHREVIELARALLAKPNPGYGAKLFLAVGLMNVGAVEIGRRNPRGSEMLMEAETTLDSLVGQPAPSARLADVFDTARGQLLVFQGSILSRGSDLPAALKKIDSGLTVYESLLAVQPKSFSLQLQKLNALALKSDILQRSNRTAESRKVLAEVRELSESIATASPSMTWVRYRYVLPRSLELVYSVREGDTRELDKRIADLLKLLPPKRDPDPAKNILEDSVHYNVACAYAQAMPVSKSEDREKLATQAMTTLFELARVRHFTLPEKIELVETDTDLDPLRNREDFRKFMTQLKAAPPVAPHPRPITSTPSLP